MRARLVTEVAGIVEASVEQVWQVLAGAPAEQGTTVEPDRHTITHQGGWWYRGEWTLSPHPDGTRVVHRVYDVAESMRWCVRPANRFFIGFRERTREGFAARLGVIARRLGCACRVT
uniref:hypothetical protein n=1 Tax=Nonomuraea pusilla TaxID=46177 RepID=UPI0006E384AF|nr:hypothetical protein [Nonomuraea pusilla]